MTATREPFASFTSRVIPLPAENVDTDQIVPARFLKVTDKAGLAEALFCDWRFEADGSLKDPPFVLDRPEMAARQILLVGDNFGTGSSREHAPWALRAWGIRAIVSTGFADIFRNNALKNGLLPIVEEAERHRQLVALVASDPEVELSVDLDAQLVHLPGDEDLPFEMISDESMISPRLLVRPRLRSCTLATRSGTSVCWIRLSRLAAARS